MALLRQSQLNILAINSNISVHNNDKVVRSRDQYSKKIIQLETIQTKNGKKFTTFNPPPFFFSCWCWCLFYVVIPSQFSARRVHQCITLLFSADTDTIIQIFLGSDSSITPHTSLCWHFKTTWLEKDILR